MHCGNRVHLFSEMDAVLFILIRKEKVQRLTLFETLAPIRKKHPVATVPRPHGRDSHYRIRQTEVSPNTARHCSSVQVKDRPAAGRLGIVHTRPRWVIKN